MFTLIVRFDEEGGHGLFEMVHANTFGPNPNPVMVVVTNNEFEIIPLPEIKDQVAVPTIGKLPVTVVELLVIHKVWLEPALAIVGT